MTPSDVMADALEGAGAKAYEAFVETAMEQFLRGDYNLEHLESARRALVKAIYQAQLNVAVVGLVDADKELYQDEPEPIDRFARGVGAPLLLRTTTQATPWKAAIESLLRRKAVTRDAWEKLATKLRSEAFTVSRVATQTAVEQIQKAIAEHLEKGQAEREAPDFVRERLREAGFLGDGELAPAHARLVVRNATHQAYAQAHAEHAVQPHVVRARPAWRVVTAQDERTRPTHRAAHGWKMLKSDPGWQTTYPPFGHNCRCRVVSVRATGTLKTGAIPDLPDPNWITRPPPIVTDELVEPQKPAKKKPTKKKPKPRTKPKAKPEATANQQKLWEPPPDMSPIRAPRDPKPQYASEDPREIAANNLLAKRSRNGKVRSSDLGFRSLRSDDVATLDANADAVVDLKVVLRTSPGTRQEFAAIEDKITLGRFDLREHDIAFELRRLVTRAEKHGRDEIDLDELALIKLDGRFYPADVRSEERVVAAKLSGRNVVRKGIGSSVKVIDLDAAKSMTTTFESRDAAMTATRQVYADIQASRLQPAAQKTARATVRGLLRTHGLESRDVRELRAGAEKLEPIDNLKFLGVHNWDGSVRIDPKIAEDSSRRGLKTLIHEEIHGTSRLPPSTYRGVGVVLEESWTETIARHINAQAITSKSRRLLAYQTGTYGPYVDALRKAVTSRVKGVSFDGADGRARFAEKLIEARAMNAYTNKEAVGNLAKVFGIPASEVPGIMKDLTAAVKKLTRRIITDVASLPRNDHEAALRWLEQRPMSEWTAERLRVLFRLQDDSGALMSYVSARLDGAPPAEF